MNLASIIEGHDPSRTALIDGDTVVSYGTLQAETAAIRAMLLERGVRPDDRVGVLAGNEPLFISASLAAVGVGARVIPMKPTNPLPELERKLGVIQPTVVLAGEDAAWIHEHTAALGISCVDLTALELSSPEAPPALVERNDDDIAFMMLTSGVSGDPKVAMLSHGNLVAAQRAISIDSIDGLHGNDIVLGSLPVAHIFGLNAVLLTSLSVGATLVLERRFDLAESLDLVRQHKISILAGAPPMWRMWGMTDVEPGTFDSVRVALSGAAALPAEVAQLMLDRHGVVIEEGYGMTETASVLTTNRGLDIKAGSVGKPVPGVDLLLVEEDGTPVEAGDSGEIVVRGPNIFKGYFNDPDTTGQVLTDDGWFWTGDVGVFDDEGYLYLVDRVKDLIIVSGFNVYPAEVENILSQHPGVSGAVVVGAANVETGETVVAHVCGDVDLDELDAFAKARLTRYKCPTTYHIVEELPVAPTGKLIRRELR